MALCLLAPGRIQYPAFARDTWQRAAAARRSGLSRNLAEENGCIPTDLDVFKKVDDINESIIGYPYYSTLFLWWDIEYIGCLSFGEETQFSKCRGAKEFDHLQLCSGGVWSLGCGAVDAARQRLKSGCERMCGDAAAAAADDNDDDDDEDEDEDDVQELLRASKMSKMSIGMLSLS